MGLMPGFGVLQSARADRPGVDAPAGHHRRDDRRADGVTDRARAGAVPHDDLAGARPHARPQHRATPARRRALRQAQRQPGTSRRPGLAGAVEATALLFTTDGHKERVHAFLGAAQ